MIWKKLKIKQMTFFLKQCFSICLHSRIKKIVSAISEIICAENSCDDHNGSRYIPTSDVLNCYFWIAVINCSFKKISRYFIFIKPTKK